MALSVNLTVPTTQVRLGPQSYGESRAFHGVPLADVFSPLMRAPRRQWPGEAGALLDVYSLRSPTARSCRSP